MVRPIVLRICTCCGEPKLTTAYTHNGPKKTYSPTCRDCGIWLFLFRQVFGKARYMDRVRISQKRYDLDKREKRRLERERAKRQPANDLFRIWGIGK